MSKSIILILLAVVCACIMFDSVSAHCRKRDRRCCRQKIEYGRCYKHVRRWAYNVTCGKCVQFDWSGCGGDDNNFDDSNECSNCCSGTNPCPKYTVSKPPENCEYKWEDGPDGCPRPRLECKKTCEVSYCKPNSCHIGQRCVAAPKPQPCNKCPCPQYTCQTDPCYAAAPQLRPCEKCVAVPAPKCNEPGPCPLVAYKENHCPAEPAPEPPRRHHCPVYIPCQPGGDPCSKRRCPHRPMAKCIRDPCDCRKCWWYDEGKTYSDDDCYYNDRR